MVSSSSSSSGSSGSSSSSSSSSNSSSSSSSNSTVCSFGLHVVVMNTLSDCVVAPECVMWHWASYYPVQGQAALSSSVSCVVPT